MAKVELLVSLQRLVAIDVNRSRIDSNHEKYKLINLNQMMFSWMRRLGGFPLDLRYSISSKAID